MYDKPIWERYMYWSNTNWALHSENSIKLISNMINFRIPSFLFFSLLLFFASVVMHFATYDRQTVLHCQIYIYMVEVLEFEMPFCIHTFDTLAFLSHFLLFNFNRNTENSLTGMYTIYILTPYIDCLIQKFPTTIGIVSTIVIWTHLCRKQYRMNSESKYTSMLEKRPSFENV